jgi:predicted exporter
LSAQLAEIPDVHFLDRRAVLNSLYTEFRITTLGQTGVGCLLVLAVVGFRYRRDRPALAAFLPSVLAGLLVFVVFALLGIEANLLHVISLELVLGMGVDYGIFIVDSARQGKAFNATLLSILLCSLTTVFVFGALTLSRHPALQAIGATTSLGVLFSFLFAPLSLVVMGGLPGAGDASPAPPDSDDA